MGWDRREGRGEGRGGEGAFRRMRHGFRVGRRRREQYKNYVASEGMVPKKKKFCEVLGLLGSGVT